MIDDLSRQTTSLGRWLSSIRTSTEVANLLRGNRARCIPARRLRTNMFTFSSLQLKTSRLLCQGSGTIIGVHVECEDSVVERLLASNATIDSEGAFVWSSIAVVVDLVLKKCQRVVIGSCGLAWYVTVLLPASKSSSTRVVTLTPIRPEQLIPPLDEMTPE